MKECLKARAGLITDRALGLGRVSRYSSDRRQRRIARRMVKVARVVLGQPVAQGVAIGVFQRADGEMRASRRASSCAARKAPTGSETSSACCPAEIITARWSGTGQIARLDMTASDRAGGKGLTGMRASSSANAASPAPRARFQGAARSAGAGRCPMAATRSAARRRDPERPRRTPRRIAEDALERGQAAVLWIFGALLHS